MEQEQEQELISLFRKMDQGTRDLYLSHGRTALVAEEAGKNAVKRQYGLDKKKAPPKDAA
jgi:hypothetical protein